MTRTISSLSIMSALAHQKYTLSDRSFREIKRNTVPCNLVFNKRSGAVVMSAVSEGLGATVEAGVDSNLTHPSGISYFSLYTFYAPNFKEVGGAYCFWVVRPSFRPSFRPSVRSSRFLMHSITSEP